MLFKLLLYNKNKMQEDEDKIFNDEPIGIDTPLKPKKNGIRSFFLFIKKHKIVSIIITASVTIAVGLYFVIPVIKINNTIFINLDASFKIAKGQTAKLKIDNVKLEVVSFTNDVCPVPGTCFGDGDITAVEYVLFIKDKKYATGSATPASGSAYQIETISSDYETYAIIKLIKK